MRIKNSKIQRLQINMKTRILLEFTSAGVQQQIYQSRTFIIIQNTVSQTFNKLWGKYNISGYMKN